MRFVVLISIAITSLRHILLLIGIDRIKTIRHFSTQCVVHAGTGMRGVISLRWHCVQVVYHHTLVQCSSFVLVSGTTRYHDDGNSFLEVRTSEEVMVKRITGLKGSVDNVERDDHSSLKSSRASKMHSCIGLLFLLLNPNCNPFGSNNRAFISKMFPSYRQAVLDELAVVLSPCFYCTDAQFGELPVAK
ncbi:hypothetical protein EG68_11190 [Paragonimus skrjabini miyazakii]|uniref:Uncharacterized protein n=1 Tax=Paragonimus skrjabini miyazakii TaxID=59628 RepID=A0A8S9YK10_9TREM|nr:hypothetical protein EG68_11190 [Paragonimus skrjabini miyazakii]